MRRSLALQFSLCLASGCGFAAAADLPGDVASAIQAQREAVDAIATAHVKAEARVDYGDGELRLEKAVEWWRSHDLDRFAESLQGSWDAEARAWTQFDPPRREEFGFDDKEIRISENWNSDEAVDGPLLPGEEGNKFASIRATLGLRDPTVPATAGISYWLLFVPFLTHDLQGYAEACDSSRVLRSSAEEIVLEFRGGPFVQRTLVVLAPSRGNLIQRIEWYANADDAEPLTVHEVSEFREIGNGVFFPMRAATRYGERVGLEAIVTEAVINEPVDPESATVRFPEGARVDNLGTGEIHVWGKGEPRLTFASSKEYGQWELSAAAQTAKAEGRSGGMGVSYPFLIANVALLMALGVVVLLRWRFSKKQS